MSDTPYDFIDPDAEEKRDTNHDFAAAAQEAYRNDGEVLEDPRVETPNGDKAHGSETDDPAGSKHGSKHEVEVEGDHPRRDTPLGCMFEAIKSLIRCLR